MKRFYMEETVKSKPKIMLHIIMPNQVSGPNNAVRLISNSFINEKYDFRYLTQTSHSGRKINFMLIRDLMRQIIEFNPDIIHITGLQGAGFHAVLASRFCSKRKILLTIRGSAIDALNISKFSRFIFRYIIEPLTMRLSCKVYAVSEAMANREYIKANTRNRLLKTIHNCAPTINYKNIPTFNLRKKLGVSNNSILVVIVGRIIYDKGITYIADAIKQINNEKIIFIFIGDKPHSSFDIELILKEEISQKKVHILGQIENVLPIINECDIFLFGTLHENLSNALLEACALGLAVIATKVGGNLEVIEHEYNGLLIPPASVQDIINSVLFLAENKEIRNRFGLNARETVKEKFSQKSILNELEKVYDMMLEL